MSVRSKLALLAAVALLSPAEPVAAQGVTTSSITGVVTDAQQAPIPGATSSRSNEPSGTRYEAVSSGDGRYTLSRLCAWAAQYTITATLSGFQPQTRKDVMLNLGVAADVDLALKTLTATEEITVTAQSDSRVQLRAHCAPRRRWTARCSPRCRTLSDRLDSFTRLSPQFSGSGSFVGQDNRRATNITCGRLLLQQLVRPGRQRATARESRRSRCRRSEEVQVNVAPFRHPPGQLRGPRRQPRSRASGTNQWKGTAPYWFRDGGMVGTEAAGLTVNPGTFDFKKLGSAASAARS
jgi:hypothetical protein